MSKTQAPDPAPAETWLRSRYGAYRAHHAWRELEEAFNAGAATAKAAAQSVPTPDDIDAQEWAGMDGTIAFHLIERHGEDWSHVGRLMEAWRAANPPAIPAPEGAQPPELERSVLIQHLKADHAWLKEEHGLHIASIGGAISALEYEQANPLGGPAKVFRAMAEAIEAGDSYEDTLRRYGFAEAAPAPQAPAWQQIETAPRDGTEVLVYTTDRMVRLAFFDRALEGRWSCWPGRAQIYPTHWTPLPAAPQTKEPTNDR